MRRGVTAAISGSCVTSTIVRPCWLKLRNSWRMASPVCESRLPVGSSAKTNARIIHQGARNGSALLLAARELAGAVFGAVGHGDGFKSGHGALAALFAADAAIDHRQLDILNHVELGQQVEELKHESDLAIANGCKLSRRGVLDHHAIEFDASPSRANPDSPGCA